MTLPYNIPSMPLPHNSELYDDENVWNQDMQPGQANLLQAILDMWPRHCQNALDVGCGDGKISRVLAETTGARFTGVDISREALKRLPFEGIEGSADDLPFPDESFDLSMSTDSFEHLPDAVEEGAWREIFRVTKEWVMVAVPFREEMLDGLADCHHCHGLYHVNWHQRRYDIRDMVRRAPEGWEVTSIVLSGENWLSTLPYEMFVRRNMLGNYTGWQMAVCPHCGAQGSPAPAQPPLPPLLAVSVGEHSYKEAQSQRIMRSHSEILAIFRRRTATAFTPEPTPAEAVTHMASEIQLQTSPAQTNLVAYPQVAQKVTASDNGLLIQFPMYEKTPAITISRVPGTKDPISLSLKDGLGLIFNDIVLKGRQQEATITLPRPLVAGYYGILLRAPQNAPIASIRLGNGPAVHWLSSPSQSVAYHRTEHDGIPVYLQVRGREWFDETMLPAEHPIHYPDPSSLLKLWEIRGNTATQQTDIPNPAAGALTLQSQTTALEALTTETKKLRVENEALLGRAREADRLAVDVQNISAENEALRTRAHEADRLAVDVQNISAENEALRSRARAADRLAVDIQNLQARLAITSGPASAPAHQSHIVMLCHDQHLDRRVAAQAHSLIRYGHRVTLFMLSYGPEGEVETDAMGLTMVRIGLAQVIPENAIYQSYIQRQNRSNDACNRKTSRVPKLKHVWALHYRTSIKFNRYRYLAHLYMRYRNRLMHDPLPFRSAFFNAARDVPCDVIQVHDLPALEAGVQLAEMHNVPLVYDAHELYPEQAAFSREQRNICSETEARLIPHAQLVFAVNDSIGDEMARRYHIRKPVTLWNALTPDTSFDVYQRYDLLREKLQLPAQRRILLFQGGFSPNRNLEHLMDAMAQVKTSDVDLVMLGFGGFGEKLRKCAELHGLLGKRIYFLDAVPQEELLQYSASADIGIIPYPHVDLNSYFCTPNKLFEFIQAGLPILANQSPELARFVQTNAFGHVAPMNSAGDIARAIDAAFSHPDYAQWRAHLLAKRHLFNWSLQEKRYLDAITPFLTYQPTQSACLVDLDAA